MGYTIPETTITISSNVTQDDTTNQNNLKGSSSEIIIGITMAALVALAFGIFNIIIIKRKDKSNNKRTNKNIGTYDNIKFTILLYHNEN